MPSKAVSTALALGVLIISLLSVAAQDRKITPDSSVRSSPAYAEILLRRTDILSDLDAFSASYTESNPKILDLRAELNALDKEAERIAVVRAADTGKLTLALGKLIVRKAALEAEVVRLTRSYSKDHPDVKRSQRRVEIFENAISEILK